MGKFNQSTKFEFYANCVLFGFLIGGFSAYFGLTLVCDDELDSVACGPYMLYA